MNAELELIGLSEMADLFGVSKQVAANWRSRHRDFPSPVAELKSGSVWKKENIVLWAQQHNISIRNVDLDRVESEDTKGKDKMAIIVALVNMKGGVGKSTLSANLGWFCAYRKNKRVLLVDLDPQFNLSQYVLRPEKYEKHITEGKPTVLDIFEQITPSAVSGAPRKELKPEEVAVNVGKWSDGSYLELLPSRLELAWTLKNPTDKVQLLNDFLDNVKAKYDLILIDCPPTESVLTTAAYLSSDYILVPVRPEFLSTIGLPLLVRSIKEFRLAHKSKSVELCGIVFNATGEKTEHDRSRGFVRKLAEEQGWYVFKNEVTYSDSYVRGSRAARPIFLTDYARSWKIDDFVKVGNEFTKRIGL